MAIATLKELIETGVHFGSQTARWDPRMKPYIHASKSGIHIIDLRETLRGLIRAVYFIRSITAKGQNVLFVGTKRQAADVVRQEASRCNSFFVCHRWLGGTLTNMETMRNRVVRLEQLEALESSGEIEHFSKKMISSLTRERKKIFRNFEGTRNMTKLPGAVVIVDPRQEQIAVHESMKLGIPIIGILDTDNNPDPIDFIIPGNDDSLRSVQCLLSKLADAVIEGKERSRNVAALKAGVEEKVAAAAEEDKGIDVPSNLSEMGSFSMGSDEGETD